MAQFDVYRNPRGGTYPLLLDVQAELFSQLETRVVIPLTPRADYAMPVIGRAIQVVSFDRGDYALVVPLLAAVSRSILGKAVGSLASRRADIISALDLLLTGT